MARLKIDPSEYESIVELYQSGMSQSDIGAMYGVSHATIGNVLRRIGCEIRVGGGQYYQDDLNNSNSRILSFLEEGWTCIAIAAHEGIHVNSLYDRLKVLGVEFDRPGRDYCPNRDLLYDKIRLAWDFGLETIKIREKLNISTDTIYKAIGDKRRGKGYWQGRKGKARASQYKGLYDTGMSIKEVAELTNSHPFSVRRLLKKYFPGCIRSKGEIRKIRSRRLRKAANREIMSADHRLSLLALKRVSR